MDVEPGNEVQLKHKHLLAAKVQLEFLEQRCMLNEQVPTCTMPDEIWTHLMPSPQGATLLSSTLEIMLSACHVCCLRAWVRVPEAARACAP